MGPLYDVTTYSFPMFMLLSVAVNVELTLLCMMLVICLPFIVCMVCPEKRGCRFSVYLGNCKDIFTVFSKQIPHTVSKMGI